MPIFFALQSYENILIYAREELLFTQKLSKICVFEFFFVILHPILGLWQKKTN